MKFVLALILCSYTAGSCFPPYVYPTKFNDQYDCFMEGYKQSIIKMEEIGIGSNPQRTAQILAAAVDLRNKNAANNYKTLTGEELSFEEFNLGDIFAKPKDTKSKGTDYNILGFPKHKLAPIE